jgi:hypothetical protein
MFPDLTDDNGRFEISNLAAGNYQIKANYLTLEKLVSVEIDSQGNSKEVEITLGVNSEDEKYEINFYPNPSDDFTNVCMNLHESAINTVILSDLSGNELVKFNTELSDNLQFNLDLSSYSAGIYNFTVINGKNIYSKILIKK